MDKKYLLRGVSIFMIGVCTVLCVGVAYFCSSHTIEGDFAEDSLATTVFIGDDYIIIGEEQNEVPLAEKNLTSEESYLVLQEMLAYVPSNVTNRFYADHWGFSLTSDNLSDRFFGGAYTYVRAVTESEKKTIWMAQNDDAIRASAVHELGHYVDMTLDWAHETDEFLSIFRNEKYAFNGSAQSSSSPVEYFAEAFQETVLHPEFVQQNAPLTYSYMTSLILSFK